MTFFEKCKLVKVAIVDGDDWKTATGYELRHPKTGLKLVEARSMKKLMQRCEAIETLLRSNHAGGN